MREKIWLFWQKADEGAGAPSEVTDGPGGASVDAGATPPAAGSQPNGEAGEAQGRGPAAEGGKEGSKENGGSKTPPDPTAWKDRRIGKITAEREDLRRRLEEAERRLRQQEPPPAAQAEPQAGGLTEAEVERRATEKAQALARQEAFVRDAREVTKAGKEKFEDFDARISAMADRLVDKGDQRTIAAYAHMVETAIKTGSAAEILHHLGGDLDEAERIMGLPPVDQGLAMARLVPRGDAEGAEISKLPPPIRRTRSGGPSSSDISPSDPSRAMQLSTDEWMKRREEEIAARRKRA